MTKKAYLRKKKMQHIKKMLIQKAIGIVGISVSILMIKMATNSVDMVDGTALLLLIPLSLHLLTTRKALVVLN